MFTQPRKRRCVSVLPWASGALESACSSLSSHSTRSLSAMSEPRSSSRTAAEPSTSLGTIAEGVPEEDSEENLVPRQLIHPTYRDAAAEPTPTASSFSGCYSTAVPFAFASGAELITAMQRGQTTAAAGAMSGSAPPAGKRVYPCRVCHLPLSSASNRVRHERSKHADHTHVSGLCGRKRAAMEAYDRPDNASLITAPPIVAYEQGETFAEGTPPAVPDSHSGSDSECTWEVPEDSNSDSEEEKSVRQGGESEETNLEPHSESTGSTEGDPMQTKVHNRYVQPQDTPQLDAKAHAPDDRELELFVSAKRKEAAQDHAALKEIVATSSRPLLQEADLQRHFFAFLTWLSQPSLTSFEALVKARRVRTDTQLQPIKLNLRFIFALLFEAQTVAEVNIDALTQPAVCKSLYDALMARKVGSSRIHVLFLLVKKILVYLSSKATIAQRLLVLPSSIESYFYVESICSDHGLQRKQETRNRAMLGAATTTMLVQQQQRLSGQGEGVARVPSSFVVPSTWNSAAAAAVAGSASNPKRDVSGPLSAPVPVPNPLASSGNATMTKAELQLVAQTCLQTLNLAIAAKGQEPAAAASQPALSDSLFVSYLVTATLCLALAPRSQVLKQLQIGTTFEKSAEDGKYWVRMLAEMSKNGRPTTFSLPNQLSSAYDYYLGVVRPRMLQQCASNPAHAYVFFKRDGQAPRSDFSTHTTTVTQRILGRPVNAHSFRAAIITCFYQSGSSQSEMNVLADIMAHDPATQRNFYYRPQFAQASVETNDKMVGLLLQ